MTAFSSYRIQYPRPLRTMTVPVSVIALATLAFLALGVYGISLRTAIGYAVEREDLMEDVARTRAAIAELEAKYVVLTQDLSVDKAQALGYHAVDTPLYVSVSPLPTAVGLRDR